MYFFHNLECFKTCLIHFFTYEADEDCTSITGLQLPGVLDELFSYDGPLGATFSTESVSLHLWAPTAQVNAIPVICNFFLLQDIHCGLSIILSLDYFVLLYDIKRK